MKPLRCFAAVELDEPQRRAVQRLQRRLANAAPGIRWIPPGQMHLTVKFFGDVPPERLPELCAALDVAAGGVHAFDLRLSGIGCFPPRGPARVVWAGAQSDDGGLQRLFDALEGSCDAAGFPRETRPFHPHITLARIKAASPGLREAVAETMFDGGASEADEIVLFQSEREKSGPRYTAISRHDLPPPATPAPHG